MLREADILTKPQEINPVIRTTVYGEPCVIFHKKNENSIAEFIGKYNFNTDKGAENTFGFADGDESWEFLNNTSDLALFKTADFTDWKDTLEARFPDGYEQIEQAQRVFEWVVSCKDNPEKFKEELEQYFDKKKLLFYYIITLVFGMVDQRAKNQFLTFYKGGLWLFIFYDNDTCFGINNEGAMAFSYDVEIHDKIGSQAVWNGADSELWILVENAFTSELQELYYDLRQKGILSYDKTIEYTNTRQSEKWCESVYNEDGYFKYERPLIEGYEDWSSGSPVLTKTGAYLYALQGSRDAHRRWWLYNRFKYLDSKFQAGSSLSDYATFRTYTPADWKGVAPNADITIKSFAAMYGTIKWGSVTKSERMGEGETKTIKAPDMQFNDTETIVYNASMIASLGNLAPLYVGSVDVSRMLNLTELVIGSNVSGYQNTNFTVLSVGSNHVLRKLDIRNCPNFTANIEVSACEAIEEIYAAGTSTTAVNLAEGGALRILQLPATVANLTLKNQPNLTSDGLQLEGMQNLVTIVVENTPQVNGYGVAKECMAGTNKLNRIRLVGIQATDTDLSTLKKMSSLKGVDESGNQTDRPVITGSLHAVNAAEETLSEMEAVFPGLEITYDVLQATPMRTVTVKGMDTLAAIAGAEVTVNGEPHATDDGGKVSVRTGKSLEVTVEADGYKPVSASYAASATDTSYTVWLDKMVEVTFRASDQYGVVIPDVKVTFDGRTGVTTEDGTAVFTASSGTYGYTASYRAEEKSGTVEVKYERDITDYKPTPNGNIQMLVIPNKNDNSVTIEISSEDTGYVIDWGDGNTTKATSSSKSYTHEYEKNSIFNVEVRNCGNVIFCNILYSSRESLLAYWTIGDSKVKGLEFRYHSSLVAVGNDLFKNDVERTDFQNCFQSCSYLLVIPVGLFDPCVMAKDFHSAFSYCKALTSVPDGLFENCKSVEKYGRCFDGCNNITSGLTIPKVSSIIYATTYEYFADDSSKLKYVRVLDETPFVYNYTLNSSLKCNIYVPDGSVEVYKTASGWISHADLYKPMSEFATDFPDE